MGLKDGGDVLIAVDHASDKDDFLTLFASVVIQGQSMPLYFSIRNYPKKTASMDQKNMEEAFFNALPRGYRYTVVADRGFGNVRIIDVLEKNKFEYIRCF